MTKIAGIQPPAFWSQSTSHRRQLRDYLVNVADAVKASLPKDGSEGMTGPLLLGNYTFATPSNNFPMPVADYAGALLYATDMGVCFWADALDDRWRPVGELFQTAYALVKRDTELSALGTGWVRIPFDNTIVDEIGAFDGVDKFTVPQPVDGVEVVRVGATYNLLCENNDNQATFCAIAVNQYNVVPGTGGVDDTTPMVTNYLPRAVDGIPTAMSLTTLPIPAIAGDEFAVWFWSPAGSNVDILGSEATYVEVHFELGVV